MTESGGGQPVKSRIRNVVGRHSQAFESFIGPLPGSRQYKSNKYSPDADRFLA